MQGHPGVNSLTGAKIDAHKALNDYEAPDNAIFVRDPYSILKEYDGEAFDSETFTAISPVPILISEGFRNVFSVDT